MLKGPEKSLWASCNPNQIINQQTDGEKKYKF